MVADIKRIAVCGGLFDTVISCETIEHLADPVQALRELHRVLRPGGCLLLTTPNYFGPFGLYRAYLRLRGKRYTEGGQPICRLTLLPRTALWIVRAGFRLRRVDAIGHYILYPGRRPFQPAIFKRWERWLWPFGLHSILVAEKP
jgi:SAM-dependent methyltransferase